MSRRFRVIINIITLLSGLLIGLICFVITGTIPLFSVSYHISDNPWLIGLIVSSVILGVITGILMAKPLSERIGRKMALIISVLLIIVSTAGSSFYLNCFFLVLTRIIGGIGAGLLLSVVPITITELAKGKLKKDMLELFRGSISLGILASFVINYLLISYVPERELVWKLMYWIVLLPAGILLFMLIKFPESPVWLFNKLRKNEAYQNFNRIFTDNLSESDIDRQITQNCDCYTSKKNPLSRENKRGVILFVSMFLFFQQLSGINTILFYTPTVVRLAGITLEESMLVSVFYGGFFCLFSFFVWKQIKKGHGRYLFYSGLSILILSFFVVSFTFSKAYFRINESAIEKIAHAVRSEKVKRMVMMESFGNMKVDSVFFTDDEAKIYRNGIIIQKLKYSEELINEGILEAEFITDILRKYEGVDFFEEIGFFKKIRSRLLAELIFHVNSNEDSRNDFAFSDEIIHKRSSRISTYETANEILNSRFNLYRTVLLEHALNINNTLLIVSLAGAFLGFSVSMGGLAHTIYHSVFSNLSYDTGNLLVLVFNGVIYFLLVLLFPIEVQKFGFRGTFLIYAFIVTVLLMIILINNKNSRIKALFENNTEDENNKSNY